MSVTTEQGSVRISHGTITTTVALSLFLVMLAFLGDRWSARFPPLPDFASYQQVKEMKSAFIDYLTPIIEYHNEKILNDRKRLQNIHSKLAQGNMHAYSELKWLQWLADKYAVEWDEDEPMAVTRELLSRVDIVPVQLAVVQAAKESSWGRSRYAVQVNNLFGQWCYQKGCGIIPQERPKGARHEVRKFSSVSDSTRSYIHNLNSHHNYSSLRELRRNLRVNGQAIEGADLVDGLLFYSELRQQYVDEIRSMIRQYRYFLGQQARSTSKVKGA